ncbi:hypothetical protein [Bosea sp. FBZP-16]|uniref:hypothetical protein n=1 Tax=Bosea sp. FBZP-16 TaxID=2065382 RepID=UPI000C301C72|nr:hypothetical protein [Bosea sp. FBZP-16]
MTFPDDIMRAAREAFIAFATPTLDRATTERTRAGDIDHMPMLQLAAQAIMAERQRCLEVASDVVQSADAQGASRYLIPGAAHVLLKIIGSQA